MVSSITLEWLHWFDVFLIAAVGVGMFLSRHGNALNHIFALVHWALVFVASAFVYQFPANWLSKAANMHPDTAALTVYPMVVLLFYFLFGIKKRSLIRQGQNMEIFGHQEHKVAMAISGLKTLIIMLVAMSWIHGRYVTDRDVEDWEKFCRDNFGNIQWPVLSTVQRDIFKESTSGKATDQYLKRLMVAPLAPPPEMLAAEAAADKAAAKNPKLPKSRKGADTADGIVNELENDRGKKHWNVKEGEDQAEATNALTSTDRFNIIYHQLSLKAISGVGLKRLALINNQTLREGESDYVKVENRKVKVFLQEIRDNSVVVRVDDKKEPMQLMLTTRQDDPKTATQPKQTN